MGCFLCLTGLEMINVESQSVNRSASLNEQGPDSCASEREGMETLRGVCVCAKGERQPDHSTLLPTHFI